MTVPTIFAPDAYTWRAQVRKYQAIARINMNNSLAYMMDTLSQGIFIMTFVFIFAQLWTATFKAQGTDEIGGLTLNQTIWYFVWAELITLSRLRVSPIIQEEVQDGSLAYTLGRPYNYILYHLFRGLGGVMVKATLLVGFGAFMAWTQTGLLDTFRPETIPLLLFITFWAYIIDYCMEALIGLSAFFFEDTSAFRLIYSKTTFILGGLLIPVDFLPGWLQGIARVLPFNLVVYAPSKLFVAWDTTQFFQVLGLQFVWLGILAFLLRQFYRYGAQRVSINGG